MGGRIAILGDIHSNLDALETVLEDCRREGVDEYLCTGDVVGYNACPHECLEIIRSLGCPVVKGNHDHYVASAASLEDFNPYAAAVVRWTREQLSQDELEYLHYLPFSVVTKGITLVHSTMDKPERFGYVFDIQQAETNFSNQITPVCFHGHTHCPMIYERQFTGVTMIEPQPFTVTAGRKYFINVGSVGQPRDGDPRAAYVIYDSRAKTLDFRRLEYDIEAAQRRIRAAGLPEHLAERLVLGQ